MRQRGLLGFAAGFVTAAVLFGGVVAGAAGFEQQITAYFRPLRFVFDGVERQPPADQQGFVYNGRTYVPLRFMAESLGRPVEYDDATGTIYVGAVPGEVPAIWANLTPQGEGSFSVRYFSRNALSLQGAEMPEAVLVSAVAPASDVADKRGTVAQVWADYDLPPGVTRMTGTLFVPQHYLGEEGERRVGRLVVLNELNRTIYTSPDLTTKSDAVPFEIPLEGVQRVRIAVSLHPYEGRPLGDSLVMAQLGISELTIK
ncbi:hypothetical protein J2Z79_001853 [Symbiobacterium terraclitae]|uniref:Copper amine oxidase-like N-terminal domain-containing protein n=1 Tax=Symbiobacterium terraclitae TaxID=557451 RepID=A0ABS4JSE2_9FIRM|nr:hypothetical protein [Symbiobacterium terraclitae]